jgi:hypothetical protein
LRLPLAVAGVALAIGAAGAWMRRSGEGMPAAVVAMMVLFFHAARLALVAFDPYMSSRPLAEALLQAAPGKLIADDQYYTFSSVFFYANRRAKLLNGRVNNLEYGSYALDAPKDVFIDNGKLQRLWEGRERCYLVAEKPRAPALSNLLNGKAVVIKESGGKFLFTNIGQQ